MILTYRVMEMLIEGELRTLEFQEIETRNFWAGKI
jgi:hypothetical protein